MTPWSESYERLIAVLEAYGSVLVAFSGGSDSALVAKAARDVLGPDRGVAVTAKSPSLAQSEIFEVERFVRRHGLRHVWIETRELENPAYASNPADRCYHCKTELYEHLVPLARERGLRFVANGVNLDDLDDWRPGLRAASERGVKSPLVEAGFSKSAVRDVSRALGLETWDKPAAACLSSRVPYGQAITPEGLLQIERGEAVLKSRGFRVVRLRHFGRTAKIEVGPDELWRFSSDDLRDEIFRCIRALGFEDVEIDPEGYRQGKLNRSIRTGREA